MFAVLPMALCCLQVMMRCWCCSYCRVFVSDSVVHCVVMLHVVVVLMHMWLFGAVQWCDRV